MKLLLVDDGTRVLEVLDRVARRVGEDVTVVSVPDAASASLALQADGDFDLVLLTIAPDDPAACAALADMRARHPAAPVVALSTSERTSDVMRLVELGAMGFVPKRAEGDELYAALSMVIAGGVYIAPMALGLLPSLTPQEADTVPSVMRPSVPSAVRPSVPSVMRPSVPSAMRPSVPSAMHPPLSSAMHPPLSSAMRPSMPVDPTAPAPAPDITASEPAPDEALPDPRGDPVRHPSLQGLGLTPRQADVLALLLKGLPNKLIARELNLAVDTVKDHVAAVLRALNVTSRTQAVLAVSQMNLTLPGSGWRAGPQPDAWRHTAD